MRRVIIGTILLVLAVEILLLAPVMLFTPLGNDIVTHLSPAPTPTPIPILTVEGTPPSTQAKAAYLLDADTNRTLVNINGQQELPMASTTKIMTAIIAIEKADPNMLVTIKQDAIDEAVNNNGSRANLEVGDQIRMEDLLYGLMLPSGDDAAMAIADEISGTQDKFIKLMNDYAKKLHLNHTHYINASGLTYKTPDGKPDPNLHTTAADLAQLARYAMKNEHFADIVRLQHYELPATDKHHKYSWDTTNDLLGIMPGVTGIKTGFTREAGDCLVFSANKSGHNLIGVVLNEPDKNQRFSDAEILLKWGFALPLRPPPATPTAK